MSRGRSHEPPPVGAGVTGGCGGVAWPVGPAAWPCGAPVASFVLDHGRASPFGQLRRGNTTREPRAAPGGKCKGWAMDIPRATVPCTTRQHRRTGTSPLFRRRARRSKVVIVAADRHSAACGQCGQVSSVPGGMEICRVAARGCCCPPSPGPSPFPSYVAVASPSRSSENRDTRFELSAFVCQSTAN